LRTGKIDFKPILKYLKEIGYNDTFTKEAASR
jgi:sugar phosphate isomerase/epimerase